MVIGIQRAPAGAMSHAEMSQTRPVAMAKPLNTERPMAAEWSGENVIMTAARAANTARSSCTWCAAKRAGASGAVGMADPGSEQGIPPV